MNRSERTYIHKVALRGHAVLDAILLAAYIMEWIKGSRTWGYILVFAAFTIIPVVVEYVVFRKDGASKAIQHIMGYSCSAMYIFVVFTANSEYVFTYCIPMFILATLFFDLPFCIKISVGAFLSNVIYAIYHGMTVGYLPEEIPDLEIRIGCMALVGIYMIWTAIAMKRSNEQKQQRIQQQQEESNHMVNSLLSTSDSMIEEIINVTGKMEKLGASVTQIQKSMGQVSSGSSETAISVQNQMQRTEQIQNHIVKVKDTSQEIGENVALTAEKVAQGTEQMAALTEQVKQSRQANDEMLGKMQELSEYTKQMNSIVETITSIAGSTGMLALNASIEAARAGEAGRGFAVVADQISGLASQTKEATVRISALIGNIVQELGEVSQAVDLVSKGNQQNVESTHMVTASFADIENGAREIDRQTKELVDTIQNLESANADIVEKIQTISSITEEVSAYSDKTNEECGANARLVQEVNGIIQRLNADAETLKAIR